MMRFIWGSLLVGVFVWLGAVITQYMSDKEQLGAMRQVAAVQKANVAVYQQQAKLTDTVLHYREQQRSIQDAARQKTVRKLYEAQGKNEENSWNFDRPLPDDIADPLCLQYKAIIADGQCGQSATAQGAAGGTACSSATGTAERKEPGLVDQQSFEPRGGRKGG